MTFAKALSRRPYRIRSSDDNRAALAEAYRPVISTVLLFVGLFYGFVTAGHLAKQSGVQLLILVSVSGVTAAACFLLRSKALKNAQPSLVRLEAIGLVINFAIYANVLTHLLLEFDKGMLIYFDVMVMVFSMSGITQRSTLLSVAVSLLTLYMFSRHLPGEEFNQFFFISVAAAFASLGMGSLLRRAIRRQIEARFAADAAALQAQRLAEKAQALAERDSLTDLPNRRSIFQKLELLISQKEPFWFGVMDLDGFKGINDSYGHIIGDNLLCVVSDRLRNASGDDFFAGRLAGDEFALFVKGNNEERVIQERGDRVLAEISEPCEIATLRLAVGGSIGFAHFPTMAGTSQELYERADFALYRSKQTARGRTLVFNAGEQSEMNENAKIERAIREAVLDDEMYPHILQVSR